MLSARSGEINVPFRRRRERDSSNIEFGGAGGMNYGLNHFEKERFYRQHRTNKTRSNKKLHASVE